MTGTGRKNGISHTGNCIRSAVSLRVFVQIPIFRKTGVSCPYFREYRDWFRKSRVPWRKPGRWHAAAAREDAVRPCGIRKIFSVCLPRFFCRSNRSFLSVFRFPSLPGSFRPDRSFFPDAKPGRLVFDTERRACSVVLAVQDKSDGFIGVRQGGPADFHRVIIRAGGAIRSAGSGDFSSFGHVDCYARTGLSSLYRCRSAGRRPAEKASRCFVRGFLVKKRTGRSGNDGNLAIKSAGKQRIEA